MTFPSSWNVRLHVDLQNVAWIALSGAAAAAGLTTFADRGAGSMQPGHCQVQYCIKDGRRRGKEGGGGVSLRQAKLLAHFLELACVIASPFHVIHPCIFTLKHPYVSH